MRKKVLALVLFVAMLLALIPGGTASAAATLQAEVLPVGFQVDGSINTGLAINPGVSTKLIADVGSATTGFSYLAQGKLIVRGSKVIESIFLPVDVDGKYTTVAADVKSYKEFTIQPSASGNTPMVYKSVPMGQTDGQLLYTDDGGTTNVTIAESLYPYTKNYGSYTIGISGTAIDVEGGWDTIKDLSTWYGNPQDVSEGRVHYISVPVLLKHSNLGSCDVYVDGIKVTPSATGNAGEGIVYVNLLPAAGGNTDSAKIEVYDRGDSYAYTTKTISMSFSDKDYSVTANVNLNAKIVGKTGDQANNFNVRLDGSTIYLDVAAQTSDDISALNANGFKINSTTAATSDDKTDKLVRYRFDFTIQPLKADGTPYDYHTRVYPTNMKINDNNNRFLIANANRYQVNDAGNNAANSFEIDSDGNLRLSVWIEQKDLIDGFIKTNNKLSSSSTSTNSFSFTLGIPGAPKFAFDIVVNNVSRTATTGTLSATELALETGASATLSVTYNEGAFTTGTTFKAYSDGITVVADGNSATVTAGATAGTYFVIVTTADKNVTIVPVVVTDPAAAVDETAGTYTITGRGVRIRTAPDTSTSKNIAKTTKKGDKVEVTSITDGWALLADGNYISAKYLTKD